MTDVDLALAATVSRDVANHTHGYDDRYWGQAGNIVYTNDGNSTTSATIPSGTGYFVDNLVYDLASASTINELRILGGGAESYILGFDYWDGAAWVAIAGSYTAGTWSVAPNGKTFTPTSPGFSTTKIRIRAGAGSGFFEVHTGVSISTFQVMGHLVAADLVAAFTGTPTFGIAGTEVDFTDQTTGTPDGWSWDFGDSGTSTSQNPSHVYADPGVYTVALTATRSSDSAEDTATRTEYIVIVSTLAGVFADWDGDGFDPETTDNVSSDVRSWTIQRGSGPEITGGSQPGSATLTLKNPSDTYNPRNAGSPLAGLLRDGTPIWIGPNSDGVLTGDDPRGLFGGRITDITLIPAGGATESPEVEIVCEDALGWYARTPVRVDYSEGRSHAQLRELALGNAGETRFDLAHEIHTMPLSHADGDLRSVLDDLNAVTGTRHFARPADLYTDWYTYTTRNRQWRMDATVDASVDAGAEHVTDTSGWRLSADTVINRQRATVTPIVFTPATFTVWQADTLPFEVTDTHLYERIVSFDDVVRDAALDLAYTGDTITPTFEPFATGSKITLTVAAGDTATVSRLTVEGRLVRRLEQQSAQADNTTSQAAPRGIREGGEIGNEYLGVIASAKGICDHVVFRFGDPQLRPTLTIVNWLPEQFDLDLYDVIAFTSSQLGMTARLFEIVGLTHTGEWASAGGVLHTVTYVLQESRVQSDPGWFYLDDDPGSLLDDVAVLAY